MKKKSLQYIINTCFILYSLVSFSQCNHKLKQIVRSQKPIEERMKQADSIIESIKINDKDSLGWALHNYAYWLYDVDIDLCISTEKKAINIAENNIPTDLKLIYNSYVDLGFYYNKDKQYLLSIQNYLKAITSHPQNERNGRLYLTIGDTYESLKDYTQAIEYYLLAINILSKQKNNALIRDIRVAYQNCALAYFNLGNNTNFDRSIKYGLLADSLATIEKPSLTDLRRLKLVLANTYAEKGDFYTSRALFYYNQALQIANNQKDTLAIRDIHQFLGGFYNTIDYEQSIAYYDKAIKVTPENDTIKRTALYHGKGQTFARKGDYDSAIKYMYKALKLFTGNRILNLLNVENGHYNTSIINFINKEDLIYYSNQIAETYIRYYEKEQDPELLQKSIQFYKVVDQLIELKEVYSKSFQSRLSWREYGTEIYSKAIKATYLNGNLEDAFYFMEKNKGLLLLQDIKEERLKKTSLISPDLLKNEQSLKWEQLRMQQALKDTSKLYHEKKDSLKEKLLKVQYELSIIQDSIGLNLRDLNNYTSVQSLHKMKQHIDTDEILIEYVITDDNGFGIYNNNDNGYLLCITKDKTELIELSNMKELKEKIFKFLEVLKKPWRNEAEYNAFNKLSYDIYTKIFPTEDIRLLIKNKKLTISPDHFLSFLPFEALITSSNSTRASYLIKETEISYVYSYSFKKNIKNLIQKQHSILGIAPVNFNNFSLNRLDQTEKEIEEAMHYFDGVSLLKSKATKSEFLSLLPNYDIIHLATHASIEDTFSPWIALYDEKINLEELYLLKNKASLVILSACNTSTGKQEIGEGIMSLARGFFYSGAQSVISTLWSVDDQSTSEIMALFYNNIDKGQSKSQALHNAKLSYIKSHSNYETSPHFWASLILLGEDDFLHTKKSNWICYLIFGIVFTTLLLYIIKRPLKKLEF